MNCAEANRVDMVEWLFLHGYEPQKIRGADHWYLSPLRDEKEASFKSIKPGMYGTITGQEKVVHWWIL